MNRLTPTAAGLAGSRWIDRAALLIALLTGLSFATPEARADAPDPAAAEAWADRTFAEALEANRITGAVVSMVQDGAIVLERGYGLDNVLTGAPADPATTRVRIGSTTKTFTATLVAMLMEEGRIAALDDPVNAYLKRYQLPDNDGVPITLQHLLTHTAGFEDRFFHIGAVDPVTVPATPGLIESLRPAYVRPAGERVVYSNFGVAVLGWVIEDLTGVPIAEHMARTLFQPLGMTATELPAGIAEPAGLAVPGLLDADGLAGPTPFTAINPAVAQTGSIVSTAHDMALYMNAQLGESPVLDAAVIERLQTPLADNAPGIAELGMVYFLDRWSGHRVVSHGGNWAGFHTWMLLLPEQRTGLFISLLSEAAPNGLAERFLAAVAPVWAPRPSPASLSAHSYVDGFLAEFFGPKRELAPAARPAPKDLEAFAGRYRADRRAFESMEALSALVYFGGGTLDVSVGDDGLFVGGAGPWIPQGEGAFVLDVPARPRMVFRPTRDGDGMILAPDIGIYTFSRIAAAADPKWQAIAAHLLLPLTALGLLAARGAARDRRRWAPVLVGAAGVVMVACATLGLDRGDSLMTAYFAGRPWRVVLFAVAANVQLVSALVTAVLAWRMPRSRVRYLLLALALLALATAAVLAQHNVIGIHRI